MTEPKRAADAPIFADIEQDNTYMWCACGLSKSQPFCDGSHSATDIKPVIFVAEETRNAALCCCKQTRTPPFCDGSHNK